MRNKIFISDIEYVIRNGMTYIPIGKDSVSDAIITVRFLSINKEGIRVYIPVIDDIHPDRTMTMLREWTMEYLVDYINVLLDGRNKGLLLNEIQEKALNIIEEYIL